MTRQGILLKFILHRYNTTFRPNLTQFSKCANPHRDMTTDTGFLSEARSHLTDLFRTAVRAVSPNEIIKKKVKFQDNVLYINNEKYPLQENVYLVGFGKAVMGMAVELEKMLGGALKKGIVSIPSKSMDAVWRAEDKSGFPKLHDSVIEYREGSVDNQPDSRSLETTHRVIDLVEKLTDTDTLIVLVSGGGSALLYMPRPTLDHEDKLQLCKRLQNAGASITELNIVRRKLSLVKGGGLARMAHPAAVITLILSDIVNDPIDLIASGPTVYNAKTTEEVVAILRKYDLYQSLEGDLKTILTSKETFNDAPLLNSAGQFKHVKNIIIGNNTMAVEAAQREALRKKLTPIILKNDVEGNVKDVSIAYMHIVNLIIRTFMQELTLEKFYDLMHSNATIQLDSNKVNEIYQCIVSNIGDLVLIGGGEPTVLVEGEGKGGRNQELAARFSQDLFAMTKICPTLANYEVMMLSAGTDGQDGPTDAAGAFGYPAIVPITCDLYQRVQAMSKEEFTSIASQEAMKYAKKIEDEESPKKDLSCNAEMARFIVEPQVRGSNNVTAESASARTDDNVRINPLMLNLMEAERMLLQNTLLNNDTYNFYSRFKRGVDLLKTGLTGTNVMDLHFIYIRKKSCHGTFAIDSKVIQCEHIFDVHNLRADTTTVEKYKLMRVAAKRDEDEDLIANTKEEKPPLNIKIVDENLTDPCCNKKRER
ncbi:glycerate kinase [Odontomachus brunneus]|uniref:glycerate kinase n=1 Tax=Odontomachus brunneus TaxID=486640 RepID=UPI0013F230C5|nr:glycerate kinase [Odontomachus brunneus]